MAFYLLHAYELPLSTSVTALIERMAQDMEQSPFHYEFMVTVRAAASFSPVEMLPLQLLEVVNSFPMLQALKDVEDVTGIFRDATMVEE